jgi:hypothetical protein
MEALSNLLNIEHHEVDMSCLIFTNDPTINREEALKRNSEIVKCTKCGVEGNKPNMMRWHFDNCKTELKTCKQCKNVIPRQGIKDYLYKEKHYCNRKCYMESKKGKAPIEMTSEVRKKVSEARKKYNARHNFKTKR